MHFYEKIAQISSSKKSKSTRSIGVFVLIGMYNFDDLREEIHFATTIMLVLTAILCLYTLFQSSLAGIPKTAYLKIIDYWNLLALSVTLVNFFTLIIWEMFENRNYDANWKRIKTIMRIGIPIFTLVGVLAYWIVAAVIYFS